MDKEEQKIYIINIDKKASKYLEKIPNPYKTAIANAISSLAYNPRPYGYIKLVGIEAYRIRIGDYRVIYEIIENLIKIDVIKINHGKDVYK